MGRGAGVGVGRSAGVAVGRSAGAGVGGVGGVGGVSGVGSVSGVGGVGGVPPVGPSCAWRGAAVSGSVCQFRVFSCVLGRCTRSVGITPLLFGCTAT